MGPILILDKSSLQSFTVGEMRRLERHYSLNVPPVLLLETIADLKKEDCDVTRSQALVTALARRMLRGETRFNLHHREICLAELLRGHVEMHHVPMLGPGKSVQQPDGSICRVYDVTWQNRILVKWIEGAFSEAEHLIAAEWREVSSGIDVAGYQRRLDENYVIVPRANDLAEVLLATDSLLSNPRMQDIWFNWIADELHFRPDIRRSIQSTWLRRSAAHLSQYAPYTFFCLRVHLAFVFGLIRGLVSAHSAQKTRIDLEYCYYLPFCMVFAYSDSFHHRFAPLFLQANQDFVKGQTLKADLKVLDDEWQRMTLEQRLKRNGELGSYPPENPESVTSCLWRKHMKPKTSACGDGVAGMPQHVKDELVRKIRAIADTADNSSPTSGQVKRNEEPDAILIKMEVPRSEVTERYPDFE